jgi:predicted GNAT family acetyltransferase
MNEIRFEPTDTELFAFNLYSNRRKIGEMLVRIADGELRVYHTFIAEEGEGIENRRALLDKMLEYSRAADLRVSSICSYTTSQLRLHPDLLPVEFVMLKLTKQTSWS